MKPGHLKLQDNIYKNLQHIRRIKLWSYIDIYIGFLNIQLDLPTAF